MINEKKIIWLASYPKSGNTWVRIALNLALEGNIDLNEIKINSFSGLIKSYLENTMSFSSNLVSKIKDKDDNSAIGFIIQTYNSAARVGNISRDFNTSDAWYDQPSNISFSTMSTGSNKASYGCNHTAANNNWGPLLDVDNGSADIYIYIGLQNAVNLS